MHYSWRLELIEINFKIDLSQSVFHYIVINGKLMQISGNIFVRKSTSILQIIFYTE